MYLAAISLLLRRWSACYSTEPFTRHEGVIQENSCIKLSFTFLAGFAQAFMYSLGAWDKHNVNFKVSSTCFSVDKKPWWKAGGLQS